MNKKSGTAIHWFRRDLRLEDNPSLVAACEYEHVIPVFIWNSDLIAGQSLGEASRWWLHHSLLSLQKELEEAGSQLLIMQGDPLVLLRQLVEQTGAKHLSWNSLYEPNIQNIDKLIHKELSKNTYVKDFSSYLLKTPESVLKKDGSPYLVYGAYFKAATKDWRPPQSLAKTKLSPLASKISTNITIASLGLEPTLAWKNGLAEAWTPGIKGAHTVLKNFGLMKIRSYSEDRNHPSMLGTSRVSPYLHFGELSPTMILEHLENNRVGCLTEDALQFTKEIFWREFSHYLLVHFPHVVDQALKTQFAKFPWRNDDEALHCWQKGKTGFPIVDAGMRELWHTGWMHNRVRMIVASFLVKDLLIPWQKGAEWFWDTLVDANLANNTQGWQWTAGCGADAAPYFRIFNPVLQSQKFDCEGTYIRKWCPELAKLPKSLVHEPWKGDRKILKEAGVVLGTNYPWPIIDHSSAKIRAMKAYHAITKH